MGCEQTFADWKNTRRAQLTHMIEGGLREGDTLCVRALGDLGRGRESKRIQAMLEDMGVTVEVIEAKRDIRQTGRVARFTPTAEQKEHLCELWYSPAPQEWVLERAGQIAGAPLNRNQMNYICGPRDGSKRQK